MRCSWLATSVIVMGLCESGSALSHGTGARVLGSTATIVELYYTGGEPMAYAEAQVFSPALSDVPFVNGRADRLGRVTFAPNQDGVWRIEARDSEGHKAQTEVVITAGNATTSHRTGDNRWLLWASLTFNVLALVAAVEIWRNKHSVKKTDTEGVRS